MPLASRIFPDITPMPQRSIIEQDVGAWADAMRERGLFIDLRLRSHDFDRYMTIAAEHPSGQVIEWRITDEELANDRGAGMRRVLAAIQGELERIGPVERRMIDVTTVGDLQRQWLNVDWGLPYYQHHSILENEKAEQRSADLFRAVAGWPAHAALAMNLTWPLRGSAGTAYKLHRRRTFSVTRDADGAQLCAVVRGVPLWDHLLGLKLLIEHDEPAFLRVANVGVPHGVLSDTVLYNVDEHIISRAAQDGLIANLQATAT